MKYLNKLLLSFTLILLANSAIAAKETGILEKAIEGWPEVIFIGKSLTGAVQVKTCGECQIQKLNITPKTRAFHNDKSVPLSSKVSTSEKPVLTVYDTQTNNVTRLYWYSK